jgi:pyruvate dehydrogenase (quinone)
MSNVSDQIVELLVAAGVTRIYGLVGDSLNALADAVRRRGGADRGGLDWVHVHNEEAAAFAASAEAQLTGRLAVCAASCGPGNTHLVQGVLDAHRSGAPVLAIATHIASRQIGTSFFQETRPEEMFRQASHYCELISQPSQVDRGVRLALQAALGRAGAAVLVVPGDVLGAEAAGPATPSALVTGRPPVAPEDSAIEELAGRIEAADRVAIFAGIGCAGARADVLALAETLSAPVGHTLRGKDIFGYDNPYDVGMTGLLGYGGCYDALHEADLVLLLGTDFPYDDFLPGRDTVQVDIDPARLGRRTPLVQAIPADVGLTARALLKRLAPRTDRRFLDRMLGLTERHIRHSVTPYTTERHQGRPIHPEYLATLVNELAAPDASLALPTGQCNRAPNSLSRQTHIYGGNASRPPIC